MRTAVILLSIFALGLQAEVGEDPTKAKPVEVGTALSEELMVREGESDPTPLKEALNGQKTILVVYRGSWCPYCTAHLQALGQTKDEVEAMGWEIVGLSPDSVATIAAYKDKSETPHRLLSDADGSVVRWLGLAFKVSDPMHKKLASYGIDIEAASGHDHRQLPVPALILIDAEGVIQFIHHDPDYSKRLKPKKILQEVQKVE